MSEHGCGKDGLANPAPFIQLAYFPASAFFVVLSHQTTLETVFYSPTKTPSRTIAPPESAVTVPAIPTSSWSAVKTDTGKIDQGVVDYMIASAAFCSRQKHTSEK